MQNMISLLVFLVFLTACQTQSDKVLKSKPEAWQLTAEQSTLSFVTTKNKTITEEHSIKFQQGQINKNLAFKATIDLNTVDTQIPIRDQRMRDILFETKTFPMATVSAQVPLNLDLKVSQNVVIPFTLNLHGSEQQFDTEVVIQPVNDQLVVVNYEPIMVNAKDFALDGGINQLTKIAGLQSINYEVLVDFKLTFEKQ